MRNYSIHSVCFALFLALATSAIAQTGTGLTGKYYDNSNFTTLVTTRTDATVNFNFASAIPTGTAITNADSFSVAWSGQLEPQFSELYTFYVTADDGARLWVDDQLIVQRTFYQGTGEMRGQIRLKGGHRVNIRVEFIENTGNASVKLEWASASLPKQVVPSNRLYPTTAIPNGGAVMREVWTGLPGTSISTMTSNANYPNKPASREFITSFECIAQNWEDNFGTRVTGFIRAPVSGSYTFAVSGDEVVQLYLSTDATSTNKALIASSATATAFRDFAANASQQSTPRTLVAGQEYYVELLHKESTGADHWSVGWKQPGDAAFSIIPGTVLMMPGTDLPTPSSGNLFDTLATEQPRLGCTRERFTWLKQQYLSPTASNAKTRAQAIVSVANTDVSANTRHYGNEIPRLACAWWLTGNSVYAEKVWTNINETMTTGDYTSKWKGFTLRQIAFAYDWLYPYWDASRRTTLLNFLINSGLNSQTNSYSNNIGILNDSGFIQASLAVGMGNEAKGEKNLSQAMNQLVQKIDQWEPNAGAWLEGTDYGILAKLGLSDGMLAIDAALGSSFGVGRVPGYFTARREPLTIASNTRQRFTFSDVGTGSNAGMGWGNWWGRRFDAPEVYDYSRQSGNSTWNALLLPESTISPAQTGMNPDTCFHGPADSVEKGFQHVATMRQNWTDSKATFVGGMGGTYMSHGMLQSGTFQLSARGVNWFVDLKSESYDVPNHNGTTPVSGADRWDYYRNRAEGHNCLIVNPTSQPDRIWNAPPAPMTAYQSAQNGQRSFAIWDLSANITGVTKVQRGIQLLGQRKQVLVQDEIVNPTATTCWWFAHFLNSYTATIGADPTTVTLQNGTERLWGKIVSGGSAWTVRSALPLPTSPAPTENANNSSYRKLAIQLTGVTNTTLAVWFVPLAPGEAEPTTLPAITALNTWNLTGSQNEAPVVSNGNANSSGDNPVDVSLPFYVTDDWTPSTQMTYTVSAPVGGAVSLLPDGVTARFTPTSGFNGLKSFSFTATDADGATSNAGTITFSVPPAIATWTNTASGSWSTAANWQAAIPPASSPGADIRFFSGQTLSASTITATNDLPGSTNLNRLTLAGTGAATTVVNIAGNPLNFVSNGVIQPDISLTGVTSGFRYQVSTPLVLGASTTFSTSGSGTFEFSGNISGAGGLTRNGSTGTLILSGNNSYTGPTTINAGTLQIGNDVATGTLGSGAVSIGTGATLRIDRTGSLDVANDISGAGTLLVSGVAMTDVVTLSGINSFTGPVTVNAGSLRVTDASQLGEGTKAVSISGAAAVLRLDGSAAAIDFPATFAFATSNPNGAIINEAGDNRIGGNISLIGGAGSTRLTSLAGTLTITGGISPSTTGRGLDLRGAGDGVINGSVSDGSPTNFLTSLSKNETGTWTLNGNNAITSGTSVSAGRLVINGSHASGNVSVSSGATLAGRGSFTAAASISGTLAPGDGVGTMNFGNTLAFGSAGRLQWEIGSNSLTADRVLATGAISIVNGAKLDMVFNSPGSTTNFRLSFWRTSRTWNVMSGPSLTGSFQLGTVTADSAGQPVATYGSFALQHTATGVNLVWTPIPGFPVIDEPLVTFTQPLANPVALPNVESTLRIAATAAGGGTITYAWSTVFTEAGGEGTVSFGNPAAADTTAAFSLPGQYILRCTAANEAVSRSADLTVDVGPPSVEDPPANLLPAMDPGAAPDAAAGFVATLAGSVSDATSSLWTLVSGPGPVSFASSGSPASQVLFSQPGSYILRLTASNSIGQAWRELPVTVATLPTGFAAWQQTNWPGVTDPLIIGPNADPDGDGATNAAEFLAGTDPKSNSSVPSFIWTQPTTGVWSNALNWNLGVAPASNPLTKLEFLTAIIPAGNVASQHDLGASFTLQRLTLNGTGTGTTTVTGGAISFATGGILDIGNGGITYDIGTPVELTAPTIVQGSPTATTRLSGGLSGSGSLTKNSTGILEITGSHQLGGALNVNAGTLRVTGFGTSSGAITVKGAALEISGTGTIAPVTGAALTLGGSAIGTMNYASSAASRFGSIVVGNGNDGAGNSTFNQSAGTINATALTLNNGFTGLGAGDYNLSGGLLAVSTAVTLSNQVAGDNIWSTMTVSGNASLTVGGGLKLTGAPGTGRNAAGRMIHNSGTVTVAGGLNLALTTASNSAARRGEYHLNGGTLNVNQVLQDAGTDTFGTFNFNGGLLKPTADSTAFFQGITLANIRNGGAAIDTNNFAITIAQALLHSTILGDAAGDGGLAKSGFGTLTLSASNTFTGPTSILGGTLALNSTGSIANSSSVAIAAGALLDVSAKPSFALTTSQPLVISLDGTGSGNSGRLRAAGLNVTQGVVSFQITAPLDDPVYILAEYTSLTGSAFQSVTLPPGYAINYAYQSGTRIALVSTSGYGSWLAGFPSLSDTTPGGDPDKDGIANLLEYVLNGNPGQSDPGILPAIASSGANFVFTFTRRVESANDTTQIFQYGSNLSAWTNVNLTGGSPGPEVSLGTPSGGLQSVTVTLPKSAAADGKFFGRLYVVKP